MAELIGTLCQDQARQRGKIDLDNVAMKKLLLRQYWSSKILLMKNKLVVLFLGLLGLSCIAAKAGADDLTIKEVDTQNIAPYSYSGDLFLPDPAVSPQSQYKYNSVYSLENRNIPKNILDSAQNPHTSAYVSNAPVNYQDNSMSSSEENDFSSYPPYTAPETSNSTDNTTNE